MSDKDLPHLTPGHWERLRSPRNEETFSLPPYRTEVVANEPDMAEIERQLAHANSQRELEGQYPGRPAKDPAR
jgi:hypothetical protein